MELNKFLKNPAYLDVEPQLAMQMAKRLHRKVLATKSFHFKLVLLSNFNLEFIIEPLFFCLYQRGIVADISIADYGTMIPELLNPKSKTYKLIPDYIIVWPTYRDIQEYDTSPEVEASFWNSLYKISIRKKIKVLQILFDKPPFININNSFNNKNNNLINHINKTNFILEKKYSKNISFINIESLQLYLGSKEWHDNRMYNICKQPFSFNSLPVLAQFFAANIAGILGKNKKVLVLDLDNTIWGGEIGDLGNKGIKLGKETSEGESFVDFQNYLKQLGDMGIILSICSKNKEQIAKDVFLNHPDMVIKLEDIACFVANFKDKASNIKYIKNFLNVSYDSIVFIDDSKLECEWVKNNLPEVTTINLLGDPSSYADQIDRLGLFIKGSYTNEDKNRVNSFKVLKKIEKVKASNMNLQVFLKNLNPTLFFENANHYAIERVEQLLLKTNQFKLNNNVLNRNEIKKNKKNIIVLRFKDKFNDYGIVVVLFLETNKKIIHIKNWVMSCRVFARNIEFAVLEILKKIAKKKLCNKITLEFIKLKKNQPAFEAISLLGFKRIKNSSLYFIDIKNIEVDNNSIEIKDFSKFSKQ